MKLRLILFILALASTAILCSCTLQMHGHEVPPPSSSATVPPISIPGNQAANGVLDITDNIAAQTGDEYIIRDAVFFDTDSLLIVADSGEDSYLAVYSMTSGIISSRYTLPFVMEDAISYSGCGVITKTANGVVIINIFSGEVIMLDMELKETEKFSCVLPTLSNLSVGDMSYGYSSDENAIYYCSYSGEPVIYKVYLDSDSTAIFFQREDKNEHLSFKMTQDGKYMNVSSYNFSSDAVAKSGSGSHTFLLDSKTAQIKESSLFDMNVYSDNGYYASGHNSYYTSGIWFDGVLTRTDYTDEYEMTAANCKSGTLATLMNNISKDKNTLVLSAYDMKSGDALSRVTVSNDGGIYVTPGCISTYAGSLNSDGSAMCINYQTVTDDASMRSRTLIWFLHKSGLEDISAYAEVFEKSIDYTPCSSTPLTNPDYIKQRIENDFGVLVYYGDSAIKYAKDHNLYGTVLTHFPNDMDKTYLTECLCTLYDALSEYPKGMLQKLKNNSDSTFAFLLTTGIKAKSASYDVIGQYVHSEYAQNVLLDMGFTSLESFVRDGSVNSYRSVIHHEMCHVMQRRIFGSDSYDVYEYLKHCPEDFKFTENGDFSEYINADAENTYFLDEYSTTSLMEDMSRLFEYAMWDEFPEQLHYPHINARLSYLCSLIRAEFSDETWPSFLYWERALNKN